MHFVCCPPYYPCLCTFLHYHPYLLLCMHNDAQVQARGGCTPELNIHVHVCKYTLNKQCLHGRTCRLSISSAIVSSLSFLRAVEIVIQLHSRILTTELITFRKQASSVSLLVKMSSNISLPTDKASPSSFHLSTMGNSKGKRLVSVTGAGGGRTIYINSRVVMISMMICQCTYHVLGACFPLCPMTYSYKLPFWEWKT